MQQVTASQLWRQRLKNQSSVTCAGYFYEDVKSVAEKFSKLTVSGAEARRIEVREIPSTNGGLKK